MMTTDADALGRLGLVPVYEQPPAIDWLLEAARGGDRGADGILIVLWCARVWVGTGLAGLSLTETHRADGSQLSALAVPDK